MKLLVAILLAVCTPFLANTQSSLSELDSLSNLALDEGQLEEAERYLLQSKTFLEENGKKKENAYCSVLNDLGYIYHGLGRMDEAETILLLALDIALQNQGDGSYRYLTIANDLGNLYSDLQKSKKAQKHFRLALNAAEQYAPDDRELYATILNNIAGISFFEGNYQQAKKEYLEVKQIFTKVNAREGEGYASCLNNLALVNEHLKAFEESEALYKEAMALDNEIFGEESPYYWIDLINLSLLYNKWGKYQEAYHYATKAIQLNGQLDDLAPEVNQQWIQQVEQATFMDRESLLNALLMLENILKHQHKTRGRYLLSKMTLNMLEDFRNSYISEVDKLRILSSTADWTASALETILDLPEIQNTQILKEEAFQFSELNKSVLLQHAIQHDKAGTFGKLPEVLLVEEKELQEQIAYQKAALLETKDAEVQKQLRANLANLNIEAKKLETKIEQNYPKYYQLKYKQATASVSNIQAQLEENSALISYTVTDSSIFTFIVDKKGLKVHRIGIPSSILVDHVKRFRKVLTDYEFINKEKKKAYQLYTEEAYWFYQLLLKDIGLNNKINKLIIIPDRELSHLPFEAFLTEKPESFQSYAKLPYLLRKYSINYNYSATLMQENQKSEHSRKHNKLLLAAAADYQINRDLKTGRKEHKLRDILQPLPAAEQEVKALAKLFQGEFLFGLDANEANFKKIAADYGVIHLAMHGLLNTEAPILSSMAFTENGDATENNFLQAYEISQMQLNADLVVLSACETGYGKIEKGEGVMSIARSFMYAGAPSLIVSMWQVHDASTSLIMQSFYKSLANGMDKSSALQQAKLEYLSYIENRNASLSQPAYWAPFIQIGNYEPIQIKPKRSLVEMLAYTLGIVAILGLPIGLFFWRKRKSQPHDLIA